MKHKSIISQLEDNISTFKCLLQEISPKQAQWKPAPQRWSILEAVNHLYDEEREDFRYRLRLVLEDPNKPWPGITPEKWVVERGYAKREYAKSVAAFLDERQQSLQWLNGLSSPDWQASYKHPQVGLMSAEMILANWLAHDYLHFRQIVSLQHGFLKSLADPISLAYAGDW